MHFHQLPLTLRYPPDQRLETYLHAPAGLIAQLQTLALGDNQQRMLLVGVSGSGKTHLAIAVCAAAHLLGRPVIYLPIQAALGQMQAALDALEQDHQLIVLDGLEQLAGSLADETALFHFHNRVNSAKTALLYTARMQPDYLGLTLPDLRSRLGQCARHLLPVLDDDGRLAVLQERALRRGLQVAPAAYQWLMERYQRDLSALAMILDQLNHASLAAKKPVTIPFLRQFLHDHHPATAVTTEPSVLAKTRRDHHDDSC